jgi:16S rRNA (guanine527-N7)-methyltransferase
LSASHPQHAALVAGLSALGIAPDQAVVQRLLDYLDLLARWNQTYNLTAVRDPDAMVTRHLLDSLAALPWVQGPRVADLGSGAGLPGIPLAILRPQVRFVLVEANGKKARFLRECVRRLALANVDVVEARAEGAAHDGRVDQVVARALAALPELAAYAAHWLEAGGQLLALKGPDWREELRGLPAGFEHIATHTLVVPGLDAGRVLVVLRHS